MTPYLHSASGGVTACAEFGAVGAVWRARRVRQARTGCVPAALAGGGRGLVMLDLRCRYGPRRRLPRGSSNDTADKIRQSCTNRVWR